MEYAQLVKVRILRVSMLPRMVANDLVIGPLHVLPGRFPDTRLEDQQPVCMKDSGGGAASRGMNARQLALTIGNEGRQARMSSFDSSG